MNVFDEFSLGVLLAAIGTLLIIAEVFFPSGGILGAFSAVAMLSAVYFAYESGGWTRGLTFAALEVLVAPIAIYGALQALPHTPMGRTLIGTAPTAEEVDPADPRQALVGRVGVARSKLLPAGAVEIDGQMIDCVSRGQAIEPGEYVKVVEVRGNRVVVRRTTQSTSPAEPTAEDRLARPAEEIGLADFDFDAPDEGTPPSAS
ncbi:MAG: NfeD family protein [Planctomycetota bacterium]